MIDPTMWGKTPACTHLAHVLEELGDETVTKRVNATFISFFTNVKYLNQSRMRMDTGYPLFINLLMEHYQKQVEQSGWPEKVCSLVLNIMVARCRQGYRPPCFTR